MFSIRQNGDAWELLDSSGVLISTHTSYDSALAAIADELAGLAALNPTAAQLATGEQPEGALDARWRSGANGSALMVETGDGRDFSACEYSFRDGPLPLMLQTSTEYGHIGATLAGWSDVNELRNGVPHSAGWFHDNDAGREALRLLRAQDRFGVSVDPGATPDIEWECIEYDDDGWCVAESIAFMTYQIAGQTMTPFPAFADAYVELDGGAASEPADEPSDDEGDDEPADDGDGADDDAAATRRPVAASGRRATGLPRPEYLTMTEPADTDERYVPQLSRGAEGQIAIPLTITDPDDNGVRHVFGHYYVEGACHIGYPDECVIAPPSPTNYANFNQFDAEDTEGGHHMVGTLVFGLDHAHLSATAQGARDHYAHTGMAWAKVHATQGRHGGWISGYVLPDVTEAAVRVLRASGLSGDWREWGTTIDTYGIQSVNLPGFPVTRQLAAAAGIELAEARTSFKRRDGRIVELHGAGIVTRGEPELKQLVASGTVTCPTCKDGRIGDVASRGRRRVPPSQASTRRPDGAQLERIETLLGTLERRTRHLVDAERDRLRAELDAMR